MLGIADQLRNEPGSRGVRQNDQPGEAWQQVFQQLHAFCAQLCRIVAHARDVPAWRGQAGDKPALNRKPTDRHDNGDGVRRVPRCEGCVVRQGHEHIDLQLD
jgi:hypothetical protein